MKRRVLGDNVLNPELYVGLELLTKSEFIQWSYNNLDLQKLFVNWVANNFDTRFTPSIDRIDSKLGYTLNNIRWVTHAENSRLASAKRWSKAQ